MKVAQLLVTIALVIPYVAGGSEYSTPFNLELYDSHISQKLANELLLNQGGTNGSEKSYELLHIANKEGSNDQYLCVIHPELEIEKLRDSANTVKPEQKQESLAALVQKAMTLVHETFASGTCLYAYNLRGMYWTYALCSADKIIQYHEGAPIKERGKKHMPRQPSAVFVLARFSKASANEVLFENQASETQHKQYVKLAERSVTLLDEKLVPFSHHSTQKAVLQIVTDGSICDITLQPRSTEVVYKCDSNGGKDASILEVLEIKTCHYRMFVHVPRLCEYAPFSPDLNTQNSSVGVHCQRIGHASDESFLNAPKAPENKDTRGESLHEKFEKYVGKTLLRDHPYFPVRADNRIDIAAHGSAPLGRGFYFSRNRTPLNTPSMYFNTRNVVLFTGTYSSLWDLNYQFAKTLYLHVGLTLLAPSLPEEGPKILQWQHSFVMWFEIYDYKGEFVGLSRIEHDASVPKKVLNARLLDPITLLDVEGDMLQMKKFERPDFQAPYDMWNFEVFSEKGEPLPKGKNLLKPGQSKETVPVTYESRQIMAYNRGVTGEDSRVNMELVDQKTQQTLKGRYVYDGRYVFQIEVSEGHIKEFAINPMSADQDFVGFKVRLGPVEVPKDKENSVSVKEEAKKNGKKLLTENNVHDENLVLLQSDELELVVPSRHPEKRQEIDDELRQSIVDQLKDAEAEDLLEKGTIEDMGDFLGALEHLLDEL